MLERGSPQNKSLHEDFIRGYSHIDQRVVNCYETVPERLGPFTVTQVSLSPAPTHVSFTYFLQVVTREDAKLDFGKLVSIDCSHRDLQRFEERDGYYNDLLAHLRTLVEEVERGMSTVKKGQFPHRGLSPTYEKV